MKDIKTKTDIQLIKDLKKVYICITIIYVILFGLTNLILKNEIYIKYIIFIISIVYISLMNIFIIKRFNYLGYILDCTNKIIDEDLNEKIIVQGKGNFSQLASNINTISTIATDCIVDNIKNDIVNIKFIKEVNINNEIEIDELKRLYQRSKGYINLDIQEIDLKDFINDILQFYKTDLAQNGLEVKINYKNIENIKIKTDKQLLKDALDELILNIVKYALENTIVYVDLEKHEDEVSLSIKNISSKEINQKDIKSEDFTGIKLITNIFAIQDIKFDIKIEAQLFKVILIFKL